MVDVLTSEQRSRNMSAIKGRDTSPEMRVRRYLHAHGLRYRLHDKNLAGRPDIVFPSRRITIFVNGCYWHKHTCKLGQVVPKTNAEMWSKKRASNVERDGRVKLALEALGWRVIVIWECELKDDSKLSALRQAIVQGR